MANEKKKTPENTGPGYKLVLESMRYLKNGMDHMVVWCGGIGILDSLCYAEYRPNWIHWDPEKCEWVHDGKFPLFGDMLDYWKKKGAKIESIGAEEAYKIRVQMQKAPESFYPKEEKPKEEKEEKPKASGKGKQEPKSGPMPHEKKQEKNEKEGK